MTRRAALLWLCASLTLGACAGQETREDKPQDAAQANADLGLAYMEHGENQVALAKLKKALAIDPDLAAAHHYIAEVYQNLGDTEAARQHFERAVSLGGSNPALQNNYAVFLCKQHDYKEALRHFDRAADDSNYGARDGAYENAGLCALQVPDAARAEAYFRHALEINPRRPESLFHLAQLEYDAGHYLKARAFLQRYFDAGSHTPAGLLLGVKVERKLGDRQTAGKYLARLREEFPQAKENQLLLESEP